MAAEPRTHIEATAAKIGNGAHVLVPKDWLGRDVVVLPRDQLVAAVPNLHGATGGAPPAQLATAGTLAVTRGADGWQLLAAASREAKVLTVWSAEHGWAAYHGRRLGGALALEHKGALLPLPPALSRWLKALLDAEGVPLSALPTMDSGDALARIRRQLQTESDPARLKALAAEMTRLLD